ncbi:PAS domain S-box protein [Sulfuricurvum sp.]|uniref:PAS domain S-box protein n=1 Tax=Sulfuricurvum sp. TaxID=2025608 RepID=UPI003C67BE9D
MSNTMDKKIEQAYQEWIAALDVVEDAIFMHDKEFHILRCNRAYQQLAALPFKQIIGQPYFDIFPKTHTPLQHCLQEMENTVAEEVQVGDTIFRSHAYAIKDEQGGYLYSLHTLEDITERQYIQRALQESEMQYRRLFEAAKDGILILDAETGVIVDANPFILHLLSYTLNECTGKKLWEIGLFADIEESKAAFRELQSKQYIRYDDLPLKTKDGRQINVEFISNIYEVNGQKVIQCNIRDITERLRAKQALSESEMQYRRLFEAAKEGILILDAETGVIVDANPFILALLSYTLNEFIGKKLWEIGFFTDIEASKEAFIELQAKGYIRYEDLPLKTKDGRQINVEFISNLYEAGDWKIIQCNIRDISERRRAQEMLIASHELFQSVVENIPVRIFWKDIDLRFLGCNAAFARDAGMSSPQELIGKDDFQMGWSEQAESYRADDKKVMDSGIPKIGYEEGQTTPEGNQIWLRTSKVPLRAIDGSIFGILGIYDDITERKAAEEALRRANRALRTLSAGNEALIRAENEDTLLRSVTRIIVEQGSYSLAVVDYADENPQKSITPMAWSGLKEKHYWAKNLSWADTEQGQLPISKVIRTGTTQICRDISSEDGFNPYKDAARSHGYVSNIALPLSYEGKTFGALSIYSSISEPFDEEEVRLLEELANDLAYGIITLRARIEHEQHAVILRRSLEQSIQIIAATVEARDPYTAGHQRRVGELATAIAQEMGLGEEQIEGVHFAAIIHDLGKIHIPAEILSKPGKLSDMEFMFIHTHPQAGYDILKEVKFPWPIADIILQHHEKLDGSGYPRGLKGDQILLESKIITVADVVEAMSSHRPYRSALGIEKALDEIRRGRGSLYHPAVVDACLKLFSEKRFTFSSESL